MFLSSVDLIMINENPLAPRKGFIIRRRSKDTSKAPLLCNTVGYVYIKQRREEKIVPILDQMLTPKLVPIKPILKRIRNNTAPIKKYRASKMMKKKTTNNTIQQRISVSKLRFTQPKNYAKSWIIINAESRSVVWGYNIKKRRPIASLTKVMTFYTAIAILKKFNIDLDNFDCHISQYAASRIGTSACLMNEDVVKLRDLFYCMMLPSGNDAAQSIAENVGALIPEKKPQAETDIATIKPAHRFITYMNLLLHEIGATNSNFSNVHGMDHRGSYSSALDIANIFAAALKIPFFKEVISTEYMNVKLMRSGSIIEVCYSNTNKLLQKKFIGKTGITPNAGPCLLTLNFDTRSCPLILAVLGCSNKERRYIQTKKLSDWAQKNLKCIFEIEENLRVENHGQQ